MSHERDALQQMHEEAGLQKIEQLKQKMRETEKNIEISEEIIGHTPSDAQRDTLTERNKQRRRATGALRKEIHDIEKTLQERGKEVST